MSNPQMADAKQLLAAAKAIQADIDACGLSEHNDMGPILKEVLSLQERHRGTWWDRHQLYWLTQLLEEVAELGNALVGEHEHDPDYELTQIAAICLNWLDMRQDRGKSDGS